MKPSRERIVEHLIPALEHLREEALALAHQQREALMRIPRSHQESARNLLYYLALRQHDIRSLQHELAELGLSRLGRAEAHTIGTLNAVLNALRALVQHPAPQQPDSRPRLMQTKTLLAEHTDALFGPSHHPFPTRIMVTMPSEAATQPQLIEDLLRAGMQVMRINCAHDDIDAWLAMIGHLRRAERALGKSCKVYADLAGPKLRTGAINSPGRLVEFKVKRDLWGRELAPALLWLTPATQPEAPKEAVSAVLPVEDDLLALMQTHDVLEVDDTRGVERRLIVLDRIGRSCLAKCHRHGFIDDQARCRLWRGNEMLREGRLGELPEVQIPIVLKVDDRLHLVPSWKKGELARYSEQGALLQAARIPCTLDAVFEAAREGQAIWFDDGKIGGIITAVRPEEIEIRITQAAPQGSKLWPEKGINLPETELPISALTEADLTHLHALADYIDIVGLSFVRCEEDVLALQRELYRMGAEHLGCVLKIETRQGFDNLPRILLAGMRHQPLGVMLARGDLAVEIGFERLSEVQEEIVCLCEAAHVPLIWATQVLETMAKRGLPTRAEVSDAALAIRAEGVMLNKGPHIVPTVEFLYGVLQRMSGHHDKQRPVLRRLEVSMLDEEA